jgi:hypothetical protein
MSAAIAVGGAVAQKAGRGGHTWVFLQYLLGFQRLGYDVLFVDRERNAYVDRVMRDFGIPYAVGDEAIEPVRRSRVFLNVMGFVDGAVLDAAPFAAYLDIDPGFPQMWSALGLADPFVGHDAFVTIGGRIGEPDCPLPTCGLSWITTEQPVVLDAWPVQSRNGLTFSTVGAWRGAYGPIDYKGRRYGLRVHEFRKFVELPARAGADFVLALDIDPAETMDLELLRRHGWTLLDPHDAARDPLTYRSFVQRSGAEFMVAKSMYVESRSGWLSDRSICYLASGRPVLAQDTGFAHDGDGLVRFSTLEEAVEGAEAIVADYARHARAARALAEERFDSDRVLTRLLRELDVD